MVFRMTFYTVATAALIISATTPGRASIYRVDSRATTAVPDGATWTTAYPTVHAALARATALDEVWVATGTYLESIAVPLDVGLYGGFAGTETTLEARDTVRNVTILQGSGANAAGATAASVVTLPAAATEATVIDGFTITNGGGTSIQTLTQSGACSGRAGGGWRKIYREYRGGGVFVAGGSPTIANNVIANNSTAHSSMTGAVSCHNVATYYQAGNGGGIYVARGATPVISGNVIKNNAGQNGGGVYCDGGLAFITGNTISGNSAVTNGGGVAGVLPSSAPQGVALTAFTLAGNTVSNNVSGEDGGGVAGFGDIRNNLIQGNLSAGNGGGFEGGGVLADNVFIANSASQSGGGVHASSACSISRCTFRTNTALDGAGVESEGGLRTLRDSAFSGNVAAHSGAAVVVAGSAVIENVTIANNTSPLGAVVLNGNPTDFSQRIIFVNNIVAGNQSGLNVQGARVAIRANNIWHNTDGDYLTIPSLTGQNGDISQDPLFVNPASDDFHLRAASPCADAGATPFVPFGDLDRDTVPRVRGTRVDMGAFETAGAVLALTSGPLHVAAGGNDVNDGYTWATPMATLQYALDVSTGRGGAEIWVEKGRYSGPFTAFAPVQLFGGFAGSESSRPVRNPAINVSVLDGQGLGTVITAEPGAPGTGVGFTLDGFDVTNGLDLAAGGGLTCAQVTVDISNNVIENNTGAQGAGINVAGASGSITQNVIRNNQAPADASVQHDGGGIFAGPAITVLGNTVSKNASDYGGGVYGAGTVIGNTISGNSAATGGGLYACSLVSRNIVRSNTATWAGGGVELAGTIEDNLFALNVSGSFGGGADVESGASILNNTFVGNTSSPEVTDSGTGTGGALSIQYGGGIVTPDVIANNIVAFNSSGITMVNLNTTFTDNDVYSNTDGDYNGLTSPPGTLTVDPQFVNRTGQDYHLQPSSPCIDAGDDKVVSLGALDLDGNPRRIGAHVDIGGYEFLKAGVYGLQDATHALEIAGGLTAASAVDAGHLEIVPGPISGQDAVLIARKAMGLDTNP